MSETKGNPYLIPISIIIAGLFIAAGVFFSGRSGEGLKKEGENTGGKATTLRSVDTKKDVIRGNKDAKLFIVEFSDFQCPYCRSFHESMKQVISKNSSVLWTYRHLPLTQIHPEAEPAAIAGECIAKLGGNDAFWTFADSLFENQETLGSALYLSLAKKAGISVNAFTECLNSSEVRVEISSDVKEAVDLGARGTPSSFIVNEKGEILEALAGAVPYQDIEAAITRALEK
jgi:protein-disulfide isomerase